MCHWPDSGLDNDNKKERTRQVSFTGKSNKKCFYYENNGYYEKDYYSAQKRKPEEEKSSEEVKRA